MLEAKAKDQGHKRKRSPKKKRSSQKFFKRSPQKNVFQKIFQALHKILTIQKIVLSSSRGLANFRGLEASRPRPRTSKCVLEDVLEAKDVLENSTSGPKPYSTTLLFAKIDLIRLTPYQWQSCASNFCASAKDDFENFLTEKGTRLLRIRFKSTCARCGIRNTRLGSKSYLFCPRSAFSGKNKRFSNPKYTRNNLRKN